MRDKMRFIKTFFYNPEKNPHQRLKDSLFYIKYECPLKYRDHIVLFDKETVVTSAISNIRLNLNGYKAIILKHDSAIGNWCLCLFDKPHGSFMTASGTKANEENDSIVAWVNTKDIDSLHKKGRIIPIKEYYKPTKNNKRIKIK